MRTRDLSVTSPSLYKYDLMLVFGHCCFQVIHLTFISQVEGDVYYEVCKDIPQGMELLVWYGDCYLQFMGVPVALKEMAGGGAAEEADSKCPTLFDFFVLILYGPDKKSFISGRVFLG